MRGGASTQEQPAPAQLETEPLEDVRIGEYIILERLGHGGLAEVLLARHLEDGHLAAIKRLLPELQAEPKANARLRREANIASLLRHPNIAQIFDAGLHEERFYIASELIDGVEVDLLLRHHREREGKEARLPLDITARLGLETLTALDFAHRARDAEDEPLELIHRDISLRNLMVTFRGELKIIDFGIAKAKLDEFKTATGALVGTPKYMSPEQVEGRPLDLRSDVYSTAVVLYELLGGRSLLRPGLSLVQVLQEVMNALPPPLSSQNPDLPKELDPIFKRALQKDPADRFESAGDFAAALQPHLHSQMASTERIADFVLELFPQRHARFAHFRSELQPDPSESQQEPTVTAFELVPTRSVPTPLKPSAKPNSWQRPEVLALWLGATALSLTATYFTLKDDPAAPPEPPAVAQQPAPKARPSFVAAPQLTKPSDLTESGGAPEPARSSSRAKRARRSAPSQPPPPKSPQRSKRYTSLERRLQALESELEGGRSLDIERVQLLFSSIEKAARHLPKGPQRAAVHRQLQHAKKCLYTCANPRELLRAAQRTLEKLQVSESATQGPTS